MANCYRGECSEFLYGFTIYAGRKYREPIFTTPFTPHPNSNQRWQFQIDFTSPSGVALTVREFYKRPGSEIRVWLFKRKGDIPRTIGWSGVITLQGFSCIMESSSIQFHLKYEHLTKYHDFVFKNKCGIPGMGDSDIHLECKMFVWGLKPPTTEFSTLHPQQPHKSHGVLKAIKKIYLDAILTDVVFTIGETKMSAHKCVLGAHSEVFRKMFEADMLEKSSNSIPIVDCDAKTFSQFLQFLYTGELDDNIQTNTASLFAVADKYNVEDLRNMCVQEMCSSIAANNVVTVFVYSYLHDDKEMKELAKTFICDNFVSVACQREWGELLITYPDLVAEVEIKIKQN